MVTLVPCMLVFVNSPISASSPSAEGRGRRPILRGQRGPLGNDPLASIVPMWHSRCITDSNLRQINVSLPLVTSSGQDWG